MTDINHLGMAIGDAVPNWTTPKRPDQRILSGKYCRVEPLDLDRHSEALFNANCLDKEGRIWVYMPYGPFDCLNSYRDWMKQTCFNDDPFFYSIIDCRTDSAVGIASYLRIDPGNGSIEVGHINYSPLLQKSIAATEAMYLLMKNAFEMGYRRYEWKCNSLNEGSCSAARRLGFHYEGSFRQASVVKGRNRDTSWFSVIDSEWPKLDPAFQSWLNERNFDADGKQLRSLSGLTKTALS